jgi:excinuclease ABC subunit A
VIVVEHEEDIIKNCDYLVDIGPHAGIHGGEVVFAGPYHTIFDEATESLTTKYMSNRMSIPVPSVRSKGGFISLNCWGHAITTCRISMSRSR